MGLVFYGLGTGVVAFRQRLNVVYVEMTINLLLPYVYISIYTADKRVRRGAPEWRLPSARGRAPPPAAPP